jgi:hypothetical protein
MRAFKRITVIVCALSVATAALAASYTWVSSIGNDLWTNCNNWDTNGINCYPNTEADDADFPSGGTVDPITTHIDQLTLYGTVTFSHSQGLTPVVQTNALIIQGGTGGAEITVVGAQINAQ